MDNTIVKNNWINKLNQFTSTIMMPLVTLTFILFNTVINKWLGERIETLQNVFAVFVLAVVAVNLLASPKNGLIPWLKGNVLVIVYFVARAISLWQSGFDYSVIRTIFFEMFFLIGICNMTAGGKSKLLYIKIFVWLELVFTALSLAIFYIGGLMGDSLNNFLIKYTYFEKSGNALLFSNPNTAGLFAAFAVVIAIILYNKKIFSNKFLIVFGVYNLIALVLFGCRSADMGLIAVAAVLLLHKFAPKLKKRSIAAITLALMILTLVPIYGMIEYHESKAHLSYTDIEAKIDILSSGRYAVWKECAITQHDDLLFGKGNLALEQADRKHMMDTLEKRWEYSYRYMNVAEIGPHNGYIGMVSGTGWVGFALFMAILFQRIKRGKHLEKGNWHLIIVFSLVINCFESLFILNRFFTCFYMMLALETDFEEETK